MATGVVRGIGQSAYGLSTPRPLWSEQDPADWWGGAVAAIRTVLAETGVAGRRGRGHRPHRPDARCRPAGRIRRGAAASHPVERPADRRGMRPDPRGGGRGAAHRDHRQRRADRIHGAEARLGQGARARGLGADRPRAAAQGLRAAAADRRACDRQGRCRRHAPPRSGCPRLVCRGAGSAGHPGVVAASDVRGSGGDRHGDRGGRRRDRPAGWHAGGGRWGRPVGEWRLGLERWPRAPPPCRWGRQA